MVELVPARIVGRIVEAEVRPDVQQGGAAGYDSGSHLGCNTVWQGGEDGIGLGNRLVDDQSSGAEMRMRLGDGLPVAVAAVQPGQPYIRMAEQQPDQLSTGVARGPDDPNSNGVVTGSRPGRPGSEIAPRSGRPGRGCGNIVRNGSGGGHGRMIIRSDE